MTDLRFEVLDAQPATHAAVPVVQFRLRITDAGGARIHGINLHVHVQIEPRTRRYTAEEQARLYEVFGPAEAWDRSVRPLAWTQTTVGVPPFAHQTEIDVPVPCTYDLEVGASKYLHAVRDGLLTIRFLFSGTIFVAAERGFNVEQVPWDREALYRMPASRWTEVMDHHFPDCGWVRIRRDTLDALIAFKGREALITWDDTILRLLLLAAPKEIA